MTVPPPAPKTGVAPRAWLGVALVLTAGFVGPAYAATPDVAAYGRVEAGGSFTAADAGDRAAFFLDRAELGAGGVLGSAGPGQGGWIVGLEAVRAMAGGSLYGVDGDSILTRVLAAHAFWNAEIAGTALMLRVGLLPEVWHEAMGADLQLRGVGATADERGGLLPTADLGATARFTSREGGVVMRLGLTNGEGARQIERNLGKTLTGALALRLFAAEVAGHRGRLRLHLGGRLGSEGPTSLRAHRLMAALALAHPLASAGVLRVEAFGAAGRADRRAATTGAWFAMAPGVRWLQLFGRWDRDGFDQAQSGAHLDRLQAGAFVDLLAPTASAAPRRLRLYLVWRGDRPGSRAGAAAGVASVAASDSVLLLLEASALDGHPAPAADVRATGGGFAERREAK